jgi:UDP-GlcNAc:undecaprenyl-phosphate GlcNAc-1-phosphate transferase
LKKGSSPMVGGKDHTTHHLVYSGLTDIKVWWVFVIIGTFASIFALAMVNLVKLETYVPVAFFVAYFVFVFVILYRNTIKYKAPKE